jgi:hypothetical protein
MTDKKSLSDKMRGLAEVRKDLPPDWLETAEAFEAATIGFYGEPQTIDVKKFMGCWARARKMWCEATGESLV